MQPGDDVAKAQAFYAGKADAYRESAAHKDRDDLDRMLRMLRPVRGERALDVATGGGHTADALAGAGCRVVATDATRDMLARIRASGALADAHAMPFRDGAFDVVACRIAPHHFRDLRLFLRECARVLAPGGRFYAFDLAAPQDPTKAALVDGLERQRDPSHVHSWNAAEWRDAVVAARLSLLQLKTMTSAIPLDPWIRRGGLAPAAEAELRARLAATPREATGGWGVEGDQLHLPRVEVLAERSGD